MTYSEIQERVDISLTLDGTSWLDMEFVNLECEDDENWTSLPDTAKKELFFEIASDYFKSELETILFRASSKPKWTRGGE